MVLSFKKQFIGPIKDGIKIHTIRLDPTKRWKAGRSIQGATGVRTKKYDKFFDGNCVSVQEISIKWLLLEEGKLARHLGVFIDDRMLLPLELHHLAINDGFTNISDFAKWFNKDFTGRIIHWTDFKY